MYKNILNLDSRKKSSPGQKTFSENTVQKFCYFVVVIFCFDKA